MDKEEFLKALELLKLPPKDLAEFLCITTRTVNRWIKRPSEITGPAKQAIRAWVKLESMGLPWYGISKFNFDEDGVHKNIKEFSESNRDKIIEKVLTRSEDKTIKWRIDLSKNLIYLSFINIYFNDYNMVTEYRLLDFSSNTCSFIDIPFLIEEAIYFLNKKSKG